MRMSREQWEEKKKLDKIPGHRRDVRGQDLAGTARVDVEKIKEFMDLVTHEGKYNKTAQFHMYLPQVEKYHPDIKHKTVLRAIERYGHHNANIWFYINPFYSKWDPETYSRKQEMYYEKALGFVVDIDDHPIYSTPEDIIRHVENRGLPIPDMISVTSKNSFHLAYFPSVIWTKDRIVKYHMDFCCIEPDQLPMPEKDLTRIMRSHHVDPDYAFQAVTRSKIRVPGSVWLKENRRRPDDKGTVSEEWTGRVVTGWYNPELNTEVSLAEWAQSFDSRWFGVKVFDADPKQNRFARDAQEFWFMMVETPLENVPKFDFGNMKIIKNNKLETNSSNQTPTVSVPNPYDLPEVTTFQKQIPDASQAREDAAKSKFWLKFEKVIRKLIDPFLKDDKADMFAAWLCQNYTFLSKGELRISQTYLAGMLNISQPTISRILKELVNINVLSVTENYEVKKKAKAYKWGSEADTQFAEIKLKNSKVYDEYADGDTFLRLLQDIRSLHSLGLSVPDIADICQMKVDLFRNGRFHMNRNQIEKAALQYSNKAYFQMERSYESAKYIAGIIKNKLEKMGYNDDPFIRYHNKFRSPQESV